MTGGPWGTHWVLMILKVVLCGRLILELYRLPVVFRHRQTINMSFLISLYRPDIYSIFHSVFMNCKPFSVDGARET